MAATGYTPIQLYYSTTVSAVPVNTNLVDGELAINTNDGKLFYKDSGGTVQTIAYKNVPISTLSGAGTGVLTALGNNANAAGGFATIDGTATLTNKRINPRVSSTASASSVTPDIASFDQYCFTALAATLTIDPPIGTPVDGNKLIFRILDDGTSRSLSWNATYTPIGVTLPSATTISKMLYVGCIYNAANTRWDVVAVTTQA